ncbi:glycoside hydrolase family 2 protein [Streptantibioticus silvisoli]|uniref:beta-mannosidase n=1 Tax=Streptantibioticus silvisoli TaxID=2705255 RepID=A0ABT6W409_9ACTN|nr:glycoside hydrolase family 2 TIM barrel-domain containing protein [Streptantibioticus silvisoli]MDI5965487.1 glycoside hydrolase family 2 TIM barrel-domain containing protein [Streptantibioticus silvisoli]
MRHQLLRSGWSLAHLSGPSETPQEVTGRTVDATVPGCVHTDLMAAGLLADPHLDANETGTRWIGWSDWRYATAFDAAAPADGEQVDLVCRGLDTVARVELNGTELGRTENQHRSYRFPVGHLLGTGRGELAVEFTAPERLAADRVEAAGGQWPNPYGRPYAALRKMACNFGWDWGPDLPTAGIWQDIGLHYWRTARLDTVRPLVRRAGDRRWTVTVHVELARAGGAVPVEVTAEVAGVRAAVTTGGTSATVEVAVDDPAVWWPRGHGDQPLHELTVTVAHDGAELDGWRRRIGFREVGLDTGADEAGSKFVIRVNGRDVFARGVNWIPDDTFVTRLDRDRLRASLTGATGANANLVRVWGGGLYESEDFYDLCDELGLLVWQDFLFACSAYPEEEFLAAEFEAEARENIVRLMPHPSLVLWNGNNENIWGWFDWGWQQELDGRGWGLTYYLDLLPRLLAELDPTRPYWAASPWSGGMDRHPNDDRYGVSHVWDVWNQRDYLDYREHTPRFAAEFGYQGPPAWSTVRRSVSDRELTVESAAFQHHQKAADGHAKLQRGLAAHFGVPADFDDWHFLTQVNQARAVRTGVEHFRSLQPHCMGTIWWQLNDCWPGASWAVIDGDGHRKPAWYALRAAYRPRLATFQPVDGGLELVVVNDTDEPWRGRIELARHAFDGERLAGSSTGFDCPARGTVRIAVDAEVGTARHPSCELVRACGAADTEWYFRTDRELAYPRAEFTATAERLGDGWRVEVVAGTLLRDLWLFPDRLHASAAAEGTVSTLLPGERAAFTVTAGADLDPAALTARPVLRCVNDIALGELDPGTAFLDADAPQPS